MGRPAREDVLASACAEARAFLRIFQASDHWIAVLIKVNASGEACQRLCSLDLACSNHVQRWLLQRNWAHYCVYTSINAYAIGAQSRARLEVTAVRHVFIDVDRDAERVLRLIESRTSIPPWSYVVHTSPGRVHVFWRARGFDIITVEALQKRLAEDFGADAAATSVTQMTRLPGFWNHKYREPYRVWVEFGQTERVYTPLDFPRVDRGDAPKNPRAARDARPQRRGSVERARAYVTRVPPAVAGHHGDIHTFQTCCRIVRGFALDDDEAFVVLTEWNARCQPPWSERELRDKIRSARRNGRESIGGLL